MKPAKFDYHAPATLEAAVTLLHEYNGEARLLAGGQSLLPMMNFRLVTPAAVIDLNRLSNVDYIRADAGILRIGAMTRHRAIEYSSNVAEQLPLLAEAIRFVAHLPIRSRGTIGGSLALADPAAELPMLLQVLEGEIVAQGPHGTRVINAADLFEGIMTTSLAADEIISEVRLPTPSPEAGFRGGGVCAAARRLRHCRRYGRDRTRRSTMQESATGYRRRRPDVDPAHQR